MSSQPTISLQKYKLVISAVLVFYVHVILNQLYAQETVFALLKSDSKKAEELYAAQQYNQALALYLPQAEKSKSTNETNLKIARCYYYLNRYEESVVWYNKVIQKKTAITNKDVLQYAEALSGIGEYNKALEWFNEYLKQNKDDEYVLNKIWRLKNIQYMYEDSIHYSVMPLSINTPDNELCPAFYTSNQVVFISNRKRVSVVNKTDGNTNAPFYKLYHTQINLDTTVNPEINFYSEPEPFAKELNAKFHEGPVAFFNDGKSMVYTITGNETKTLQLYFASLIGGKWKITSSFPYNSSTHSLSTPTITNDGKILFFSADFKGGFGGKDLYRSINLNGQWSKPENLGETINTISDETFPYFQNQTLYFASNGHPGLGGLDIFKCTLVQDKFTEVTNLGYPVNTFADEFALALNANGAHGYFASNRNNKNNNDDLYEIDIDLQVYPMNISGLLKYKEISWKDSSELKILANAELILIDNFRNIIVDSTRSDSNGNFSITIPYFSQYKIIVKENNKNETTVSLDLSKRKAAANNYDIVVVKDAFKNHDK